MTAVGILGTGTMGGAMARRLAAEGFEVVLYNRSTARAEALADAIGARTAPTPRDLAAAAEVVISMLSDDAAVLDVYGGEAGAVGGLRAGSVAVDMSTVLPEVVRTLEPQVRARGAGILDAPVSGSWMLAESGRLTVMVGGEVEDVERARPVLDSLAATVFHLGGLGAGATTKLAVNTVIFGLNQAIAEGLVLAERAGVDRALAYEVIAKSAAGAPYVEYKRASFLAPETTPVAFAIELAQKDLRLISSLASDVGLAMPQTAVNLRALEEAERAGLAGRDFSAVAEHLRASAGETRAAVSGDQTGLGPGERSEG